MESRMCGFMTPAPQGLLAKNGEIGLVENFSIFVLSKSNLCYYFSWLFQYREMHFYEIF